MWSIYREMLISRIISHITPVKNSSVLTSSLDIEKAKYNEGGSPNVGQWAFIIVVYFFVFKTGLRLLLKIDRSSMPRKLFLFLVFPLNILSGSASNNLFNVKVFSFLLYFPGFKHDTRLVCEWHYQNCISSTIKKTKHLFFRSLFVR